MSTIIRLKRGLRASLPSSAPLAEPLVTIDTGEIFIGMGENLPIKKIGNIPQQPIPPINPNVDDLWIDTSNQVHVLKHYDGIDWVIIGSNSSGEKVKASSSDSEAGYLDEKTDNISLEVDVNNQKLQIKNDGVTIDKLAQNIDATSKNFNADKVDGKDVDDTKTDINTLWTSKKISDELASGLATKADINHTHSLTFLSLTLSAENFSYDNFALSLILDSVLLISFKLI